MAQYLNRGAATLAASAWSGSGIADNETMIINVGMSHVTGGLSPAGLTTGPDVFLIGPDASGTIGGGSAGPFILTQTGASDYFAQLSSRVSLYLRADTGGISNFLAAAGKSALQGGSFGTVSLEGGENYVTDATTISTELDVAGGRNTIEYLSTAIPAANFAGTHETIVRRVLTAATLSSGLLDIDYDDAISAPTSAITITGGTCRLINGIPSTIHVRGGLLDFRYLKQPTSFSGKTIKVWAGGRVLESNLASNLTITYVGAQTSVARSPLPGS